MRRSQGVGAPKGDAPTPSQRPEKTSFSLSPDAKYMLTSLKADLRRRGHAATESAILEALILGAEPNDSFLRALNDANTRRRKTSETK